MKFDVELLGVTPPKFSSVDSKGLAALMARGVPLIDIRRPEEWKQTGVVKGSHLLTAFDDHGRLEPGFHEKFSAIVKDPSQEFAMICRTGSRTGFLSYFLSEKAGYTKVYSVSHGIEQWIADKQPVVRP